MRIKSIKNIRLEVGNGEHYDGTLKTETDLFNIYLDDQGKIENIVLVSEDSAKEQAEDQVFDAQGKLALPAFKEMHNHLDKTYLSIGWRATKPVKNIHEQLNNERQELEELSDTMEQRASAMIDLLMSNGVNHIRTHVNIDPYEGLSALKTIKSTLEKYDDYLTYEIVAFPQFGMLIHDEVPDLLRQALENGADILGGLDPGGRDNNVEDSLQMTMDIAKEYDVPVDIHLHDADWLGYYTIDKWIDMMEEQGFDNEVAFDHLYGVANVEPALQSSLIKRMAENNIRVMSAIPFSVGQNLIPIKEMVENGIDVSLGCDGFYDSWKPYVSGDLLEKLRNYCEFTGVAGELALRNSLALITNGVTSLNDQGERQWPKSGDLADLVLVDASSSAEVVARVPKERTLITKGRVLPTK